MRIFALLLFLCSSFAHADGVITIKGRLTSDTPKECALETKDKIYYFSKKLLSPEQLSALKPGRKQISLTVPFSSIDRVQAK